MGNLRSVQKAFERVGAEAIVTGDVHQISSADKVVLPGVGAFRDAIGELKRRELVTPIRDVIESGKPFLGICLGLQLLFDVSYEGGQYEGLGAIPGEVVRFEVPREFKVPHMGWNQAIIKQPNCPLLQGVNEGDHFYFVHSYYVVPKDNECVAIEADYHQPFTAMVWKDNLYATQFHPEKSQSIGLQMLKNFSDL
ncbi:MAG: imidazole glycerol phosphate synthase subunit HisH, partial [Planctomycetales bacterium]|nr:imidazole glycerol phosphate synthase subunit HisH [Planctomycetales bacterium]